MFTMAELYYFSPTGGTRKVGLNVCEEIAASVKEINLGQKDCAIEQPSHDIIVVAAPVFGGRIPAVMADKLRNLDGNGKKAVSLVVYGNRAYEDALLELNHVLTKCGFQIVASGAFIAQHSIVPEVGQGRPDEQDIAEIRGFAKKVLDKLSDNVDSTITVPGNFPYKDGMKSPATPISLPTCTLCGACAEVCPTEAIFMENGTVATKTDHCILCMACTAACSQRARILPPPLQEKMGQVLGALKSVRRENEYFL